MIMGERKPVPPQLSLRKLLGIVLLGLGLSILVFTIISDRYYCLNGSRIPQPSDGKIYHDVVCHGSDVYLTRTEYIGQWLSLPMMIACGGTGVYLLARVNPASRS